MAVPANPPGKGHWPRMTRNEDKVLRRQRRADLRDFPQLGILAAIVGIVVGLASLAFRGLVAFMHNAFFLGEFSYRYDAYQHMLFNYGWLVFIVPAVGGLIVGLLIKYGTPEVKGHGVPEVMTAVMNNKGRINPKVGFLKIISSAVTIGSGGSTGMEGPIIQIGSSGGSSIGQALGLSDEKVRILVGCGAAAGIAATFNAPIAGVVFAIELILLELKTKSFFPLVISSVAATTMAHIFIGRSVVYPLTDVADTYVLRSPYEIPLYLILGIIAGLAALFFVRFFYKVEDFFDGLRIKNYTKPMVGGLLLGVTGLLMYEMFGGYFIFGIGFGTLMPVLLSENVSGDMMLVGVKLALFMLLLMFLKMLATSLSLGSGGSGGIFAPSLWIGAMLGGAFGIVANMAFPGIAAPFGAYALVGMAAFFAGASRATLTAIIILFEMTGTYDIILPLMIACVVSDTLYRMYSRDTIYTMKIRRQGVHYSYDRGINILATHEVGEVMAKEIKCITGNFTLGQASDMILTTGHQAFPYLDSEGKLCGIVTSNDLKDAIREGVDRGTPFSRIGKVCRPEVAYPDEELQAVLDRMIKGNYGHVPVVDREDPTKLVGFITRKDILRVYRLRLEEMEDHRK